MNRATLSAALLITAWTACGTAIAQDQDPAPTTEQPQETAAQTQEAAAQTQPAVGQADYSEGQNLSFALGYNMASMLKQNGIEIDPDALAEGVNSGLGHIQPRLEREQIEQIISDFQIRMQRMQFDAMVKAAVEQGQAYLDQNAQQEGVTVTESGLQYRVIQSGDGPSPSANDSVFAHYHGTLIDGTVFDSSLGGDPASFEVGRVIPGWVEALQLMKVGDKWELVIPADLAYGEAGIPQAGIGPNAVLVFQVELLGIQ